MRSPTVSGPKPDPSRLSLGVACLVALPVALALVWPIFAVPWWENHDMVAYPVRLIEYAQGIRLGNLFPRWCPDMYGGYGSPFFNFYAPGLFAVATPLVLAGLAPALALKLAVMMFTAAGLVGSFLLAQELTGRRDVGLLVLAVFGLAPYRYTQLITRGDLAEYCAIALVPCAAVAYLRLWQRGPSLIPGLAAATLHAAVLFTHTLTGQWFTEFAAIGIAIAVARALRTRDLPRAAALLVAFGGALGLTSIYALPALLERNLTRVEVMTEGGFSVDKNFVGELKWLLSPGFFFIGYPTITALLCAVPALAAAPAASRRTTGLWLGISAGLVLLMTSLTASIWHVLPFARFTQFPWRLLGFLALSAALLCGALWRALFPSATRASHLALAVLLAILAQRAYAEYPTASVVLEQLVPTVPSDINSHLISTTVSDEYLPLTAPAPPRHLRHGWVDGSSDGVDVEDARRAGVGMHLMVHVSQPGTLDVQQHWFPGWRVRRHSGPAETTLGTSPNGMIRVSFPEPGRYELFLGFGPSPPRVAGQIMTAISALLLPILLLLVCRWRPAQKQAPQS
jgi:hypothetical protein